MSRDGDDRTPFELQPLAIYGRSAPIALRDFRCDGTLSAEPEFAALSEITDGIADRFVAKYTFVAFGHFNSGQRFAAKDSTA